VTVIVNTTVISNFAVIGQLDILRGLFRSVTIAMEVYDELIAGLDEGYEFYSGLREHCTPFSEHGWIRVACLQTDEEIRMFERLPARLHRGEAASMAIAYHRGLIFLTDDRAARKASLRYDIPISGSLGCLVACVERGLADADQANAWLTQMIEQGFRSPVRDLQELVKT
jgi:predicted nucleic acid-binding protein